MSGWGRRLALLCLAAAVLFGLLGATLYLLEGRFTQRSAYFGVAAVASVIASAILDPAAATDLVSSRQARFGSLSVVVTSGVLALLVLVNVLASRGTQAFDLTRAHLNTIAPQSIQAVRLLDSDLEVIGFFRSGQEATRRDADDLLSLYREHSQHVKVRFQDPATDPAEVRQLNVTIAGTIALRYKGRSELLTLGSQTEQDVTSAILKLESNRSPTVCWSVGEGERDLNNNDQVEGYSSAKEQITKLNFKVQNVIISQVLQLPPSCDMLALVGPQKPLTDASAKLLSTYLSGGGKLLVAVDPWSDAGMVNQVLKPYGLSFTAGLVIETDPGHFAARDQTTSVVVDYGSSSLSKNLARQLTFFPQSTAITGTAVDATATPIATSTAQAYEVAAPRDQLNKQAKDKSGPFTLMETLEKAGSSGPKLRVVLMGTTGFAENRVLDPANQSANLPMLQATLRWLAEQDNLISIPPKPARSQAVTLTDQEQRFNVLVCYLLLPGLVALGGVLVWWRRRTLS